MNKQLAEKLRQEIARLSRILVRGEDSREFAIALQEIGGVVSELEKDETKKPTKTKREKLPPETPSKDPAYVNGGS